MRLLCKLQNVFPGHKEMYGVYNYRCTYMYTCVLLGGGGGGGGGGAMHNAPAICGYSSSTH